MRANETETRIKEKFSKREKIDISTKCLKNLVDKKAKGLKRVVQKRNARERNNYERNSGYIWQF